MIIDSERPDRDEASEILSACAALPLSERSSFLETRCEGRPALRAEVEALLPYLHDPEFEDGDEFDSEAARAGRRIGSEIGGCRLIELLAIGGMGAVYRAEQESPRREVALKLLRPDSFGTDAWRRLKREALALGRLDHPAIARIFTAGIHRDPHGATPFLIMELVEGGRPVTDWWRDRELPLAARLARFATMCEAIHHGHIKGVLHRDVKPANLLVDREDRPKVIDFGIARMLEPGTDDGTAPVTAGRIIGTVAYMAPERLEGGYDADVRSDVYGLGVVLYELLTGRLPYGEPNGSIAVTATAIALGRVTPPSRFNRRCRGDLDAIVAKAMSPDPADRYDSASALAADLRSHLASAPIQARGVARVTRIRKFLIRNLLAVTALAVMIASLAVGLALSLKATARAERALYLSLLSQGELTVARNDVGEALRVLDQIGPEREDDWPVQVLRGLTNESVDSARFVDWKPVRGRLDRRRERMLASGSGERAELVVLGTAPATVLGRIPLPMGGTAADWGWPRTDGSETVIAGLADGSVVEIQAADGTILRELSRIEQTVQNRGEGPISDVALDPSGRWIAIGHSGDAVRLLGMSDGTVRDLRGYGNPVTAGRVSVEWNPEGVMLAIAAAGGTFVVDAASGQSRRLSSQACNQAVFAPDGKRIATALRAGGSEVIDVETAGSRLISPAEWPITGIDWSPDGETLAIIGHTHWVIACDASSGTRKTFRTDVNPGLGVRWFTETEFCTIPEGQVFSMRSPPGRVNPLGRGTSNADRWELRLRFVDGGRSMICTGPDGRIDRIDPLLRTRTEIVRVPVITPSTDVAPDAESVAMVDGVEPGPMWIIRPREGETRRIDGAFLGPVAISPDGRRVVACGPSGEAVVVDVASGQVEHRQGRPTEASTTAFAWIDSERILWCLPEGRGFLVRDSDSAWSFHLDHAASVEEAWGRGNGLWYWTDRSQRLMLSAPDRIGDGAVRDGFRQEGIILCLSHHPTLPLVAVGKSDGRIVVLDESMGEPVASFHRMSRRLTDLTWSPDGSMLASIDIAGGIFVFDSLPLARRWPEIERRRRLAAEAASEPDGATPPAARDDAS